MQYKKLTGIILKKQNYKEADQIITIWTESLGKIRVSARGVRLPKSRLVYNLSELSVIEFEVAGRKNFPTIINAKIVQNWQQLKQDLLKIGTSLYAAELIMKMTADEQSNSKVYQLLVEFLQTLNRSLDLNHYQLLDKFALNLAQALGFGEPKEVNSHSDVREFIEGLIERRIKSEIFIQHLSYI